MGNPVTPAPVTVVQQQGQPEPASAPAQQSSQPSVAEHQINQAEQFGAMTAEFRRTQSELQETRGLVAQLQADRESDRASIRELREGNQRLLQIAEQAAAEEEAERQRQQATPITPPAPETPPAPADQPARQKQNRFKTFLFGREEDE